MAKSRVSLLLQVHDKASRQMSIFNNTIARSTRGLRSLAGGVLMLAGVGGFGYMIKKTMESIDVTAKLSDRIGMATEDLIGMQYGAKIMGVDQETLNKSLEQFSKRLGEVKMGIGEARYALDEIGLSAEELARKTPTEALGLVADALIKLETQADKTAAAQKLFGRSGIQMTNLLMKGSQGIAKLQEEAERLGLTFSRFDAAGVEAANDALYRMRSVFTGIFRQITIQLAPHIEALATSFVEFATSGPGLASHVSDAFEHMTLSTVKLAEQLDKIPGTFKAIEAGVYDFGALYLETFNMIMKFKPVELKLIEWSAGFDVGEKAAEWRQQAQILAREAAQTAGQYDKISQTIEGYFDKLEIKAGQKQLDFLRQQTGKQFQQVPGVLGPSLVLPRQLLPPETVDTQATKKIDSLIQSLERQAKAIELVNSGQAKSAKMAEFMLTAYETYGAGTDKATEAINRYQGALNKIEASEAANKMDELNQRIESEIGLIGRIGQSWEHAKDRTEYALAAVARYGEGTLEAAAAIEKFDEQLKRLEMAERWQKLTDVMESSFSDAMEKMIFEGEKFGNVMKMVFREIVMEAIRIQFIRPAAQVLSSLLGGLMGGLLGGGGGAGVLTASMYAHEGGVVGAIDRTTWAPASVFENAPSFHTGKGVPAWVAENEHILTPEQMDRLVSMAAAPRTEQLTRPKVTLINNAGVPLKIDESASRFSLEEIVLAIINQNYDRGGSVYDLLKR